MKMDEVSIIGAGPVGCYLGCLLAGDKRVKIYEEHNKIGVPVQCTGIVTKSIFDIIDVDKKVIVNKLRHAEIIAPNNKSLMLDIDDIVLDRKKFDVYLSELAEKRGAEIFLNHKFIGIENGKIIVKNKNQIKKINTEYLLGTDGPLSKVAEIIDNNNIQKRRFYFTKQAVVKGNFEKDVFKVYLGSFARNFFAWIVPENESIARIGIGALHNPTKEFDNFLERIDISKKQILSYQGGLIPIYNSKVNVQRTIKQNNKTVYCAIAGDSAAHVKATTGGGIVPGIKAANILGRSILEGKDYKNELKKVNMELKMHSLIRKTINKFSDNDYNKLIELLNTSKAKNVLKKHNRDNSIRLIFELLLKEPRLAYFAKKLL